MRPPRDHVFSPRTADHNAGRDGCLLEHAADVESLAVLSRFRLELHGCLGARETSSAAFIDWESMTAAVGSGWRPDAMRLAAQLMMHLPGRPALAPAVGHVIDGAPVLEMSTRTGWPQHRRREYQVILVPDGG